MATKYGGSCLAQYDGLGGATATAGRNARSLGWVALLHAGCRGLRCVSECDCGGFAALLDEGRAGCITAFSCR